MSTEKLDHIRAKAARMKAAREAKAQAEAVAKKREESVQKALREKTREKPLCIFPNENLGDAVAKKAPRVLRYPGFTVALNRLHELRGSWVRPLSEWTPAGKSPNSVFRSLCEHLLAKYPMPGFLWRTFFEENTLALIYVVAKVAGGASFYKLVTDGLLPVPLTRKMCHEVLTTVGDWSFLGAIRRAQVRAEGGDGRLFRTWMKTRIGRVLHDRAGEEFWQTVIRFLAQNPMFDRDQIEPMLDYITVRRNEDPGFSMKGRSALALLRAVEEWHMELQRVKATKGQVFLPSGFHPAEFEKERKENGQIIHETWRVFEILNAKALADEGRAMNHCVYSYAQSIEARRASIWSITMQDPTGNWRMLTVEVWNEMKKIVQARGRFNKVADPATYKVLTEWAHANNLTVESGRL